MSPFTVSATRARQKCGSALFIGVLSAETAKVGAESTQLFTMPQLMEVEVAGLFEITSSQQAHPS